MRDGPGRRALKRVARWWFYALLLPDRHVRRAIGLTEWDLGGECRRCAACCEQPTMKVERLIRSIAPFKRAFLWWQLEVNGFELVEERDGGLMRFACSHFDADARACDSYASRPGMCRDYPRVLLRATTPRFLDRCGYRAVARNADDIRAALADSGLDSDKIRELEKKLGAR